MFRGSQLRRRKRRAPLPHQQQWRPGGKEQPGFQASELASARAQRGSPEAFLLARVWEVRVKAVEALPLRWASGPGYGSVANTHRQRNPWAGV